VRGSIIKRGSTYSVVLDLGRGPDDKRIRRWHSGYATKDAAEKARVRLLAQVDSGSYVDPSRVTMAEYLHSWLEHVGHQRAGATHERYEYICKRYLIPHLGSLRLQQLGPLHVQRTYDLLEERGGKGGRPLASGTVALCHRVLRRALKQAVRWQLVNRNVCEQVDPPTAARGRPAGLEPEHARVLLGAARGVGGWVQVFVIAGVATGCRRGELLGLRWADVDLEHGTATIRRSLGLVRGKLVYSPPKTEAGERTLELPAFALAALRAHRKAQAGLRLQLGGAYDTAVDLVICREDGSPLRPDYVTHRFKRLVRDAGLPEAVHTHTMRHGFASLLAAGGEGAADVAKVLGHGDGGQLALRVYIRPQATAASRAAGAVERALGDPE
jgi:integrase